jgi:hypothetical protein
MESHNETRTNRREPNLLALPGITAPLRKTRGLHGGDYEECCLLGYKNPVRTSQETRYVSATEPSQLMICKI